MSETVMDVEDSRPLVEEIAEAFGGVWEKRGFEFCRVLGEGVDPQPWDKLETGLDGNLRIQFHSWTLFQAPTPQELVALLREWLGAELKRFTPLTVRYPLNGLDSDLPADAVEAIKSYLATQTPRDEASAGDKGLNHLMKFLT